MLCGVISCWLSINCDGVLLSPFFAGMGPDRCLAWCVCLLVTTEAFPNMTGWHSDTVWCTYMLMLCFLCVVGELQELCMSSKQVKCLCLCLSVCVCVYVYVCVSVGVMCLSMCVCMCKCVYMCVYLYICMYVCLRLCICACICVFYI